jgi:hypothetical protein
MESKLNALLVIITFITLSVIGFLLKVVLKFDFDSKLYFWYILLLCGALVLFGRPLVLLAIDLIRTPYRGNMDQFPIAGDGLPDNKNTPNPPSK